MWSYSSYNRPVSWDNYHGHSASLAADERRATITSGVAAGLTLTLFFVIFLITLGCRLYNSQRQQQQQQNQRYSLSFVCPPSTTRNSDQLHPPPSYENAIRMPIVSLSSSAPPPSIDAPFRVPKALKKA